DYEGIAHLGQSFERENFIGGEGLDAVRSRRMRRAPTDQRRVKRNRHHREAQPRAPRWSGEWGVGSGKWGVGRKTLFPTPHFKILPPRSPFTIPHSPLPPLSPTRFGSIGATTNRYLASPGAELQRQTRASARSSKPLP